MIWDAGSGSSSSWSAENGVSCTEAVRFALRLML